MTWTWQCMIWWRNMVRCPPGKYDFTARSKSDCPQPRRNTRLRAYHSLSERQESVYRHIVTLLAHYRGGPLVTRDCFWRQIPSSPILPPSVFLFFAAVSGRAYCLPTKAKTSFESPVSALHAKPFVAARILLNMRQASKQGRRK